MAHNDQAPVRCSCPGAVLKRPAVWGTIVAIAVIALLSLMYFYPDALEGNQLRQPDMQQGAANSRELVEHSEATGTTAYWTNSLFSGMPAFQISPSYPSTTLFAWITTVYGLGLPAPANLLAMMMIGFFILLMTMRMRWYTALIGAVAYGFSSYFVIIIGAGHLWKFITLAYVPPTVAGLMLCYRGRYLTGGALTALFAMMQVASNHVQMSYYFMFVMLGFSIVYLIEAWRNGMMRRWCMATGVLAVAAVLAVGANLPSLYNTYEYSKETMRGRHSELTQPDGTAAATASGLDRNYILQYSYGGAESFSLLIPNVKGGASAKPVEGRMTGLSLADLPEAEDMYRTGMISADDARNLQVFSQYFGEPEGTNGPVYVGALVVALFLFGALIVRGPMKWMLVVLTGLSVCLALGRNMEWLSDLFIDYVPMYNKFRTVESILVIAEFTMPLLAMMALRQFLRSSDPWGEYRRQLLISFGVCLGVCLVGIVAPGAFGHYLSEPEYEYVKNGAVRQMPLLFGAVEKLRHGMVSADALRSFLIIGIGFSALALYARRKIGVSVAVAVTGVLILFDMFSVDKRYLSHESFCTPALAVADPFEPTAADKVILADTSMNYRVMDIPRFMMPDPSYHHKAIGGYHAAKLTRYQDLIDRHLGHFLQVGYNPELRDDSTAMAVTGGDAGMAAMLQADLRVLDMLNARYVVNRDGSVVVNPYALGNAWFVGNVEYVKSADDEMDALSVIDPAVTAVADEKFRSVLGDSHAAVEPGDTIYETSYAPGRLTYRTESRNGGVAVFSEVYFPWGWNVTVDGEKADLARVDYLLRALRVPAGSHEIVMEFDPESLHVTDTVATVAVAVIYLALLAAVVATIKRRRDDCPAADTKD